ncbi:hypothetical protein [Bacillus thuringiensis]|uniref:hypothetical protein n=1 Tax=Bacillus thuringiensis TaxID=1428 RepID=UPI0015CF80BE|nr:hypothetical protein [Bacillus thuringiensis]
MLNKKTKTRCKECGHVAEVKKLSAAKFGVYCKNIQCAKKYIKEEQWWQNINNQIQLPL